MYSIYLGTWTSTF